MSVKLYRVHLRGASVGIKHYDPYVIAENATEAIEKVQSYLEKNDIGFRTDRVLDCVQLLAEDSDYPDCNVKLFL